MVVVIMVILFLGAAASTWVKDYKKLPTYNIDEAIVRYCLSCFGFLETEKWNKCEPDYQKCLPKYRDL